VTGPGDAITGVVLAGGRARRMGGRDKGLLPLAGRPAVAYAVERLRPQVDALLINANRHRPDYAAFGVPVVPDTVADYPGPLAGMAAGLEAAATGLVLTVPTDSPWLPMDLAARLRAVLEAEGADIATAHNGEGLQPVFALLRRQVLPSLQAYLAAEGRKIDRWFGQHRLATADFSDCPRAFANINTPEELAAAERALAGSNGGTP